MLSANLYDFSGEQKGKVDLPSSLFGGEVNRAVLYDTVRMYLANRRSGSAKTKSRGEVRFSNVKPYRQKGTGRARAGRRSSPIWRKGGVVFGPRPRSYGFSVPKKVRRLALKSALADKCREERVAIVEGLAMESPRTRRFSQFLRIAGMQEKKILLVTEKYDDNVFRSVRNIPGIEFMVGREINALQVLKADILLLTKEAVASMEEVFV
ncbi:MAG: 50S ribosomal protein L4 [Candidatus Krumholzibacteriota bacterium]|nr:50S ribosomal protein L4 [Candidatus Krumholzibacteriota bacterium]